MQLVLIQKLWTAVTLIPLVLLKFSNTPINTSSTSLFSSARLSPATCLWLEPNLPNSSRSVASSAPSSGLCALLVFLRSSRLSACLLP